MSAAGFNDADRIFLQSQTKSGEHPLQGIISRTPNQAKEKKDEEDKQPAQGRDEHHLPRFEVVMEHLFHRFIKNQISDHGAGKNDQKEAESPGNHAGNFAAVQGIERKDNERHKEAVEHNGHGVEEAAPEWALIIAGEEHMNKGLRL